MVQNPNPPSELRVSWYCVAFIDILGQSEFLKSFADIPFDDANKAQKEQFRELCRNTYGRVASLHEAIENTFQVYTDPERISSGVPPKHHDYWRTLTGFSIKKERLSDGVLVFVSLDAEQEHLRPYALHIVISTIGLTQLLALNNGYAIRGGIDVGHGALLPDSGLYGPGIYSAYKLESQIAGYPRVVIGDHAINYLRHSANLSEEDIDPSCSISNPPLYAQLCRSSAALCMKQFCLDDDGHPIVDFLSSELLSSYGDDALMSSLVRGAWDFVLAQCNHFKHKRDPKLAFRYALLRNYFMGRTSPKIRGETDR